MFNSQRSNPVRCLLALTWTLCVPFTFFAQQPTAPKLEFAFELRAEVAEPTVVGEVAGGTRRIVNILGGDFKGPQLSGKLLPGGADWQIIRSDGFTEVDARY